MSNFCANCGAETGGGKFCPKCGSAQGAPSMASANPSLSQMPYAPSVRRKSHLWKIVLAVVGLFLVAAGVLAVKGYYFLKETVQEAKQLGPTNAAPAQETQAGCELLSKERVAKIVGVSVAATKGNEAGEMREYCNYLSAANLAADAKHSQGDEADPNFESKDHKPSLKDLESLAKQISNAAKNRPLLVVQIYRGNGGVPIFGLKTANRLMGGGLNSIPGPWDEAYFAPQDTQFAARKGQNAVMLDLTQLDHKHEVAVALAKEMIAGL